MNYRIMRSILVFDVRSRLLSRSDKIIGEDFSPLINKEINPIKININVKEDRYIIIQYFLNNIL